jgi:hypothetical protein
LVGNKPHKGITLQPRARGAGDPRVNSCVAPVVSQRNLSDDGEKEVLLSTCDRQCTDQTGDQTATSFAIDKKRSHASFTSHGLFLEYITR